MNYLDTNFVAALFFEVRGHSEIAHRYVRRSSQRFIFTELTELECRRTFFRATGRVQSEQWERLQALLTTGDWQREAMQWARVMSKAAELCDRHALHLPTATLDTLHVAHALVSGCNTFLSFDTNSDARLLAAKCRLKVYPDLTLSERSRH